MKWAISLLLIIITGIKTFSCSCGPGPNSFCESDAFHEGKLVVLARVVYYGTDKDLLNPLREYPYIKVIPLEFLQNFNGSDTLRIYGQDGFNCNAGVENFSEIDTVLFSISKRMQSVSNYDLSGCGLYSLYYSEGLLYGNVTDSINGMLYDNFKIFMPNCKPVSVEEKQTIHATLFPNPASEQVEISIPPGALLKHGNALQFQLFDITGRTVHAQPIASEKTLSTVSQLPPGIYSWRIASGNHLLQSGRLAKQ